MIPVVIGIIVVIAIVCAIVGVYNNLVTLRNRIDNAWQNIDTQLQRRCDLIANLVEANNVLSGALRQLFAVAESYPDLKANANFAHLQATLEDTENKVSYARQSYNDCVLNYNNAIQTFPGVIFAGIFQFKPRTGFEASNESRQAPKVQF